jgi:hypothetical protein
MLIRLAIIGLLIPLVAVGGLAFQGGLAGAPKQRLTKPDTSKSGQQPAETKKSNQPAPDAPTAIGGPSSQVDDAAKEEAHENLKIQKELALFTGLLVFVGLLQAGTMAWQAWLLWGSLAEIHTQAGHMERQTKVLEDSVAVAQKSANASLAQVEAAKSTQRAQLRIEFAEPDFVFNEELGGYPLRYQVFLDGTTRAYIPQNSIFAYMGKTARAKRGVSMELHIPRNFAPEMSPYKDYTLLRKNEEGFPDVDTDPGKSDLVEKHNFTVFVDGYIGYRDIFGDEWNLGIDRVWVPNSRLYGEGATGGMWVPFSSGRYDTHRKVDTSHREQFLKERENAS